MCISLRTIKSTFDPPPIYVAEVVNIQGASYLLSQLGKALKKNEALLHADYDLTLREIRRRLKAELYDPKNNCEEKKNNARPKESA